MGCCSGKRPQADAKIEDSDDSETEGGSEFSGGLDANARNKLKTQSGGERTDFRKTSSERKNDTGNPLHNAPASKKDKGPLGHTHKESITDQQASERSPDVFVSHCKRLAASEDRAVWVADVSRVINLSPERSP